MTVGWGRRNAHADEYVEAVRAGESCAAVARRLGIAKSSVQTACRIRGVRSRHVNQNSRMTIADPTLIGRCMDAIRAGETLATVAAREGVAASTVWLWAKRRALVGLTPLPAPEPVVVAPKPPRKPPTQHPRPVREPYAPVAWVHPIRARALGIAK